MKICAQPGSTTMVMVSSCGVDGLGALDLRGLVTTSEAEVENSSIPVSLGVWVG